ncbi:MAG: phosphoketolase family protein [bacterium]
MDFINNDLLEAISKYLRLTNYLSAAQLYLKDNFFLERPLQKTDLKARILGHWGTVPGLNFIYANLNILVQRHQQEVMFIAGPGHGYPALLANLFVDGTLAEFYPEYKFSQESFGKLIKNFSWPGGFPSHANPETPGVILEGGELGYALATAFGAAFDNPELIVACVVGDGEAETGATATAWHSNKFLNPKTSGAVLPIVHINQYKISGPTIYGTMSNEELDLLFRGYGYEPIIVAGDFLYEPMLIAMETAYQKIKFIQDQARNHNIINKPAWPVILLKTKKGWGGPITAHGKMIENSFRSHGIPLENVQTDPEEFKILEDWLKSYQINKLFTKSFEPVAAIRSLIPSNKLRLGMNKHANGQKKRKLNLPNLFDYALQFEKPFQLEASDMEVLSKYLRDLIHLNPETFRLMSPDETESNKLHKLFEVTKRAYIWPVPLGSENLSPDGRVMEILSEHTLEGWMQGYVLTGRHSIFISYEAFMMIVASMVDQFAKFLKQMKLVKWRKPIPSLNLFLTSTSWRQDHNGFSHQNPGFISDMLNKFTDEINIHFPADANTLLATVEDCLKSENKINIIVACKRPVPQYLSLAEAKKQINEGIVRWSWAGNEDKDPDVVFVSTGDYATEEIMAALQILKEQIPELKTRYINVSELTCFGIGDSRNTTRINLQQFHKIFGYDRKILYAYHGYPEDIMQLIFNHPDAHRFQIFGYREEGTTTTPFDMMVRNQCSRYHLCLAALEAAQAVNPIVRQKYKKIASYFNTLLLKHHLYIREHGEDIPEVLNFKWKS